MAPLLFALVRLRTFPVSERLSPKTTIWEKVGDCAKELALPNKSKARPIPSFKMRLAFSIPLSLP